MQDGTTYKRLQTFYKMSTHSTYWRLKSWQKKKNEIKKVKKIENLNTGESKLIELSPHVTEEKVQTWIKT